MSADGREYTLDGANGVELERGMVGDSVGRRLGFQWVPASGRLAPSRTVEFSLVSPRDAALTLGEQFPNAFRDQGQILSLPMFAEITRQQQDEVIELIRKF